MILSSHGSHRRGGPTWCAGPGGDFEGACQGLGLGPVSTIESIECSEWPFQVAEPVSGVPVPCFMREFMPYGGLRK